MLKENVFFPPNSKFSKIEIWIFKNFAWRKKSWDFFSKLFFDLEKKYFFGVGKKFEYSFEAEIHDLSIYEGPRVIPELLPALIDRNVAGCWNTKSKTWKSPGRAGRSWPQKIFLRRSSSLTFGSINFFPALRIVLNREVWCSRYI